MEKEKDLQLKAGARHNQKDRDALQKIFEAVMAMGADSTPQEIAYPDLWSEVIGTMRATYESKVFEAHGEDAAPYTKGADFDYGTSQILLPIHIGLTNQGWLLQHAEPNTILELEHNPHITLHYGVDKSNWGAIAKIASETKPFTITLGKVGLFEREKKDVVFLHVRSAQLQGLGLNIQGLDGVRPSDFEGYTPHVTIGYLLPGTGEKLQAVSHPLSGEKLEVTEIHLTDADGEEMFVKLGEPLPPEEISYNDLMQMLRDKLRESGNKDGWIAELYPSTIIYSSNDYQTYYRAPYTYHAETEPYVVIHFADAVEVEEKREWVAKAPVNLDDFTGEGNALKSVVETDKHWVLANHILLWDRKDLEGRLSHRVNGDGTMGEYFTKATQWESDYTATGVLYMDLQHGMDKHPAMPGRDDILGWVDMKGAVVTEEGLFARRILNLQNKYVKFLKKMVDQGLVVLGSSSEPVQSGVRKTADGEITAWPLFRDTVAVTPMQPENIINNHLEELPGDIKSFIESLFATEEPEPEGDEGISREVRRRQLQVRKAKLRLKNI